MPAPPPTSLPTHVLPQPLSPPLPQVVPRTSPSLVFINVSPIEYGHVLLVPRALDNLQQLVTPSSLLLALQFAREAGACLTDRLCVGGGGRGAEGQQGADRRCRLFGGRPCGSLSQLFNH